jgi:hypothetical protein
MEGMGANRRHPVMRHLRRRLRRSVEIKVQHCPSLGHSVNGRPAPERGHRQQQKNDKKMWSKTATAHSLSRLEFKDSGEKRSWTAEDAKDAEKYTHGLSADDQVVLECKAKDKRSFSAFLRVLCGSSLAEWATDRTPMKRG